jgi:hypothetical protein
MDTVSFFVVFGLGFFSAVFLGYTAQQILLTRDQKGATSARRRRPCRHS